MLKMRVVLCSLMLSGAVAVGFIAACSDDTAVTSASGDDSGSTETGSSSSGDSATGKDATVTTDSGGDGATSGEGGLFGPVALVYAGRFNNIDQRMVTTTLGDDGRILGYDAGPLENIAAGTATIDGISSDTFAKGSRWINGTVLGRMYDDGGVKTLLANEGQHLGIAMVAGSLPATGTATYTLAAATKPTLQTGATAEGTVTSGSLTAEFGGNAGTRIGFTLVITMPDGTFEVLGNGGAATVGDAGGSFTPDDAGFRFSALAMKISTDAGTCAPDAGTCPITGTSRIVFAGPNAERIVIAYSFGLRHGVVIFQK